MSEQCIKVAFVGAGYMVTEHLKAFKDIPGVNVCGIFSRTLDKADGLAKEYGVPNVFSSIDELYEKTHADLVVIAVNEMSVNNICSQAFSYPWTCLIEKPAGYNVSDAQSILKCSELNNAKAYVAFNRRYYSSTRTVVSDLEKCDGPRLIHVFDQEDQVAARVAGWPELIIENWMYANSIHLIDYFSILGRGEITSVEKIIPWNFGTSQFVCAKINYSSGDIGLYEAVWNAPGPWAVTVTTKEKRWELRPLEQASYQVYGSRKHEPAPVDDRDLKYKPGLMAQAEEAIKAVRGEPTTLPTLKEAMFSMKLVEAIY